MCYSPELPWIVLFAPSRNPFSHSLILRTGVRRDWQTSPLQFEASLKRPAPLSCAAHGPSKTKTLAALNTMRGYCSGSQGAVLRHANPAPCSILRGARCAAWRPTPSTLASSSVQSRTRRSPPLLLPAPEAATFSTAAGSPDSLGRLRHLAARLSPQHASKGDINALVKKEEAAARHRDQLAELVRLGSSPRSPRALPPGSPSPRREPA